MSQGAQNTMPTLRNEIEAQSLGWTTFQAASAQGYQSVLKKQATALDQVFVTAGSASIGYSQAGSLAGLKGGM